MKAVEYGTATCLFYVQSSKDVFNKLIYVYLLMKCNKELFMQNLSLNWKLFNDYPQFRFFFT